MHKYFLTIIALYLFISCSSDSGNSPTEPEIDSTVPKIELSIAGFPENSSTESIVVSNNIEVNINATDAGGIAKIEAFINNEKVGEDTTAPYQIIIDISSYTSKNDSTNKYKNYVLKVVATDKSGNTATTEQTINIDNELPVISEVSLTNRSIINGEENLVSFSVSDNEEINSVNIFLNDNLVNQITNGNYEASINTLSLEDGGNVFKIEATDSANNIAIFKVNFISDNTGPEITLNNLEDEQLLDELITITSNISDELSEVVSFEVQYDDENIFISDNLEAISFDFNSEEYKTGNGVLSLVAKDDLGNETKKNLTITILRRLLTINNLNQFINQERVSLILFASTMTGELLDIQEVNETTTSIVLRTTKDISLNTEYMVTFAEKNAAYYGETNDLSTILNINRSTFKEINLTSKPNFSSNFFERKQPYTFPLQGFWNDDTQDLISIRGHGFDYSIVGASSNRPYNTNNSPPDTEFLIYRYNNTGNQNQSENVYFNLVNLSQGTAAYAFVDWNDFSDDYILNDNIFTSQGMELNEFSTPNLEENSPGSTGFRLYGYKNAEDLNNNIFHRMADIGFAKQPTTHEYWNNSVFEEVRVELVFSEYIIEHLGEPLSSYPGLDWDVNFNYENETFHITKETDNSDILGKIFISDHLDAWPGGGNLSTMNGQDRTYRWQLIFNSQSEQEIILPKIPEQLQSWVFNNKYKQPDFNQGSNQHQLEIRRYDNILSYEEYLQKIIRNNKIWYLTSPLKETKFKNTEGGYNQPDHFLFD